MLHVYYVALSPGSHIMGEKERQGGKICRGGERAWYTLICVWAKLLYIFIDDISGNIGNVIYMYVDINSGPPSENECHVISLFYAIYVRNIALQITVFCF